MQQLPSALVWLRRDLRLHDNAALYAALKSSRRVWCAFVFDREILDALPARRDRRVEFIRESAVELNDALAAHGSRLIVCHGRAREEVPRLAAQLGVAAVFVNHDYEPAAVARDATVGRALAVLGIDLRSRKDHVIFEKDEVLTAERKPYAVFSAYRDAWLKRLVPFFYQAYPVEKYLAALAPMSACALPPLADLGFERTNLDRIGIAAGARGAERLLADFLGRIDSYRERRDFPAVRGPSYLSFHVRFGTISIRRLVALAAERSSEGARTWLNELIWRDFFFMILHFHPRVTEHAFRPEYDALAYRNDPEHFAAWCEGRTGYPLVDAGMRQLDAAGYMHNRLRMVTASFLVKDLHVDWRWGERHFAQQLNDYDLAANNGGWQWAASTGCDAQPYFRMFNPVTQSEKFDPTGAYIRRYVPELARVLNEHIHAPWRMSEGQRRQSGIVLGEHYPEPIVDHAQARQITLELYGRVKTRA
ncbi:MAG: deoxyribodipyrimidine photo-lyase [Burkholderiales bacterium]|nr:deoxyribodipyrimidine photo-lyase [Burkholderiales bacterium]